MCGIDISYLSVHGDDVHVIESDHVHLHVNEYIQYNY